MGNCRKTRMSSRPHTEAAECTGKGHLNTTIRTTFNKATTPLSMTITPATFFSMLLQYHTRYQASIMAFVSTVPMREGGRPGGCGSAGGFGGAMTPAGQGCKDNPPHSKSFQLPNATPRPSKTAIYFLHFVLSSLFLYIKPTQAF